MSEQAKHTPGPWEWRRIDGDYYKLIHWLAGETFPNGEPSYVEVHSDGSACGEYGPDIDVHGPDAKLIAAAPDLLAACKQAMHCLTAESEAEWRKSQKWDEAPYHFLFEAISKAEGRTP